MKRRLRVYKKTVSIVNETAIGMYESLVGNKKGFIFIITFQKKSFFVSYQTLIHADRCFIYNADCLFPEDWSEIWDMILSAMRKYCRITIRMRLESRPSR